MTAFVNRFAFAATLAIIAAAPVAAQECDPLSNTRGNIGVAYVELSKAIQLSETGNPTRELLSVLKLAETGADNPLARNYLKGQAYVLLLMRPNSPAVMTRGELGLSNPTVSVDLYAAADSAFTAIETASPNCVAVTKQWRQQKPWLNMLNASIAALNAGQLDSAEIFAKRSLVLDRSAPYAYSVLGSITQQRMAAPNTDAATRATLFRTATEYWQQTLTAAGTDTTYEDVRSKTLYELANAASLRAEQETGAAKRAAAREAIKPWMDYMATATDDLPVANAVDHAAAMYIAAGDSASVPKVYAPMLATPSRYGENTLVHAGVVATHNARFADATALFNAALTQNPYSRDAINNLAASYIQTNEFTKAMPLIDRLVALDPSNPDNPLLYAFAYQGLYKGTKDKKLQKTYTDSLIYFNNLSENAPVKVAVTEFSRRPAETIFSGNIKNLSKASKTYALAVEFLDKSGNVVGTETASVGPVAANATQNFRITFAKGGVYGYRYKPVK